MSVKHESVEIRVSIKMEYLYKVLSQLTLQKKKELQSFLQKSIIKEEKQSPKQSYTNRKFLETEFGHYITQNADSSIDINEIRRELSAIQGSLADDVINDREER